MSDDLLAPRPAPVPPAVAGVPCGGVLDFAKALANVQASADRADEQMRAAVMGKIVEEVDRNAQPARLPGDQHGGDSAARILPADTPASDLAACERMLGVLNVTRWAGVTASGEEAPGTLADGIEIVLSEADHYVAALRAAASRSTTEENHEQRSRVVPDHEVLPVRAFARGLTPEHVEGDRRGGGEDGHGPAGRTGEVGRPAEAAGGEGLLRPGDDAVAPSLAGALKEIASWSSDQPLAPGFTGAHVVRRYSWLRDHETGWGWNDSLLRIVDEATEASRRDTDEADEMNVLHQVACRLWEPGDWEPRWERWLAWWEAHRTGWLGPRRAFGVWLREELGTAVTATPSLAGALTEIAALRAQLVAQQQRHEDELADLRARHAALLGAIRSDAQAATHQTIGQYRTTLIRLASRVSPVLVLLALTACGGTEPTPPRVPPVWYCGEPRPAGADPRYCQIPRLEEAP